MLRFLFEVILISLSGVMAPGAITAATLAAGVRQRHAGVKIAVGHGIIEFPLILALIVVAGVSAVFDRPGFKISVGLAGGAVLILLAAMMLPALLRPIHVSDAPRSGNPLWSGIILSGGNPYFLLWWATIGLGLITKAKAMGMLALALFAICHWLCDLVWLDILSNASFRGSRLFGPKGQRLILAVCALAMAAFGVIFLYRAAHDWLA